jgi:hypothetical protein
MNSCFDDVLQRHDACKNCRLHGHDGIFTYKKDPFSDFRDEITNVPAEPIAVIESFLTDTLDRCVRMRNDLVEFTWRFNQHDFAGAEMIKRRLKQIQRSEYTHRNGYRQCKEVMAQATPEAEDNYYRRISLAITSHRIFASEVERILAQYVERKPR